MQRMPVLMEVSRCSQLAWSLSIGAQDPQSRSRPEGTSSIDIYSTLPGLFQARTQ